MKIVFTLLIVATMGDGLRLSRDLTSLARPDDYNREANIFDFENFTGTIQTSTFTNTSKKVLRITNNKIDAIEDGALCSSPFETILFQDVSLTVTKEMFGNCSSLETLLLYNGEGGFFENDAFSNLQDLKELYLVGFENLTELRREIIYDLTSLEAFGLRVSGISKIDLATFDNLNGLRNINLNLNNITEIQGEFKVPNLQRLDLTGNFELEHFPWSCLKNTKNFTELHLHETNVKNFDLDEMLRFAPNLKELQLGYYPSDCDERNELHKKLLKRGITIIFTPTETTECERSENRGRSEMKKEMQNSLKGVLG